MIDYSFAGALASLVATGLAPGDEQLERATAVLGAIGVMLINADPDNARVREILAFGATGRIARAKDGTITVSVPVHPPEPK